MRRLVCLVTMVRGAAIVSAVVVSATLAWAQAPRTNTLNIYVVDVEGGNATIVVSPSGESLLIDAGNGGMGAARDAGRIIDAVKDAGVTRIDHLLITHWHGDHYGGLAELASRIPIRQFIDHGANTQPNDATDRFLSTTYPALYATAMHMVVKAGDRIPVAGLDVRVVASAGEVIRAPLAGAGRPNPLCGNPVPVDAQAEDHQSVATHITFGRFRALHPGDLTRDKEYALVCPANRVGPIDVLLGPHHGQDTSNSEPFIHALQPKVAIMNNGTRKGGYPDVMKSFYTSPGFEDLWQMHFSLLSGQEYAAPGLFIANGVDDQPGVLPIAPMPLPPAGSNAPPPPVHNGRAFWIKVSAQEDGTFTVTNARNTFSKVYGPGR
jgi:competence protein ComEC